MSLSPEAREEALSRLASARVGHLATAAADGLPHAVPLCFALVGEAVYSVVDDKPKKSRTGLRRLRNLEENPRASLLVDHYEEDWKQLWFVCIEGDASLVRDSAEYRRARVALRAKYPQYLVMEFHEATHPMIRIRIDKLSTWQGSALR
ncbi:MAG: TIGR03668 family PPOX class F420-dependent oxidoreductase [Candidatus Binatia bacterium]